MSFVQCLWWTYSSPWLRLSRKRFLLHTEDAQVTVHFQYPVFTSFYKDTCTKNRQKTVNSFCKVKIEAWFLPCVCFINSPSSLHWYDSTRQLSSHFAWWLENVSFTLLRLKSSLNRVSLWMEKKLHQLEKQTLNSQLKQHLCDVILIMLTQWTHPPITKTWSSILKCFTANCRQATAPRRPWWRKKVDLMKRFNHNQQSSSLLYCTWI